jgi:hypothetical protein
VTPGPNLDRNQQHRKWLANQRIYDWANVEPGGVPDSVRIKAEKRKEQRAKANAAAALDGPTHSRLLLVPAQWLMPRPKPLPTPPPAGLGIATRSKSLPTGPRPEPTPKPTPPPARAPEAEPTPPPAPPPQYSAKQMPCHAVPMRIEVASSSEERVAKRSRVCFVEAPAELQSVPKSIRHIERVVVSSHCESNCCFTPAMKNDGEPHFAVRHLFHDPHRVWHDGRNLQVQCRIIAKHGGNFAKLIRQVKEALEAHRSSEMRMSFFCKAGKHRSVACTEMFACIFRTLGMQVSVHHDSLANHGKACQCRECNGPPTETSDTLTSLFLTEFHRRF